MDQIQLLVVACEGMIVDVAGRVGFAMRGRSNVPDETRASLMPKPAEERILIDEDARPRRLLRRDRLATIGEVERNGVGDEARGVLPAMFAGEKQLSKQPMGLAPLSFAYLTDESENAADGDSYSSAICIDFPFASEIGPLKCFHR